jgi:hypothetical protein
VKLDEETSGQAEVDARDTALVVKLFAKADANRISGVEVQSRRLPREKMPQNPCRSRNLAVKLASIG